MAYNRRSGGYGGYGSGGGAGGGRFNSGGGGGGGGGYRSGAAGTVNPWQSSSGAGGPIPRQSQGGHHPPAQLALASNIISKLLTTSNSMPGNGYGGGPNRNGNWGNGPRMAHIGMRQRQDGPGGFNKDNRRRGGDQHGRFSGGGRKSGGGMKDGEKRKSAGKINDENKKGQNERERTKEQLDADKKASYVGVPSAVLYCHVCSKHMWDSESFEKHVRGRPHELMMTYLDEAYRMRVDYMRHQIKAVENQREIDLERVTNNKHKSNSGSNKTSGGNSNASKPLLRSYCPMCDVRFYGPLTGHRKSDRHRKLKQFLHPECKLCDALFHTRLEMDEHKLTAGHLKKVAEVRNQEYPFLKDDEFDLIDMIKIEEEEQQDHDQMPVAKKYEMLGDRDATKLKLELEGGSNEKRRGEKKDSLSTESNVTATITPDDKNVENGVNEEENGVKEKEENGLKEEENGLKDEQEHNEKKEEEMETSNVTLTAEDSTVEDAATELNKEENINAELTTNKDNITVAYDPNVAIGKELLVASKGYVCRLCNCFLLDEQRVSIHCQTAAHYINYTTMTKMKEATSGGKKRSIDQVNEDDSSSKQVAAENIDESGDGIDNENVVSQEPIITDSEEPDAKRLKLETEENNKMDTSEQQQQDIEVEPTVIESTPNVEESVVQENTVEVVETPAIVSEVVPEVVAEVAPVVAPVVTPVVTPTRGRGGRGRGGRGGTARRARR